MNLRGLVYVQLERIADALSDFSDSIELDNKVPATYYFRGAAYFSMKKYKSAWLDLSTALHLTDSFDSEGIEMDVLESMIIECECKINSQTYIIVFSS